MKKLFLLSFIFLLYSLMVSGQSGSIKKDPVGKWTFEAPFAPEGYTAGIIEITFSDSKYHASMGFANSNNAYPGGNVSFTQDTLKFNVFVEDQDVAVNLTFTEESKMTGKAVYSAGMVPLTLTREIKKD